MCCPVLQSYREGLQLLCQAYDSDPRNPAVLNLLAHYCLTRREYAKVGFLTHPDSAHIPPLYAPFQTTHFAQHAVSAQLASMSDLHTGIPDFKALWT